FAECSCDDHRDRQIDDVALEREFLEFFHHAHVPTSFWPVIITGDTLRAQMIRQIAIIGTGTMGRGIAHLAALAGYETVVHDSDPAALDAARPPVESTLRKGVEKAKVTDADARAAMQRLHVAPDLEPAVAEKMRKQPIVVADSPGFATSRLGVAIGLEAIRMLQDSVATAEDIDRAMELGYNHPMGPLRLTDIIGLDVRLGIAEYLASTLGPRFEPPELLRRMVAEGKLGKKTGVGFYRWRDGG